MELSFDCIGSISTSFNQSIGLSGRVKIITEACLSYRMAYSFFDSFSRTITSSNFVRASFDFKLLPGYAIALFFPEENVLYCFISSDLSKIRVMAKIKFTLDKISC